MSPTLTLTIFWAAGAMIVILIAGLVITTIAFVNVIRAAWDEADHAEFNARSLACQLKVTAEARDEARTQLQAANAVLDIAWVRNKRGHLERYVRSEAA